MQVDPQQLPPPGWYPDPASGGKRQRFWDGGRWTQEVRRLPGTPGRGRSWLIPAVAAGLVLLVVGTTLIGLGLTRRSDAPASAAGTTPETAVSDPPRGQPSVDPAMCAVGEPSYRGSHPGDGRLYGGGLVMDKPAGWSDGDPNPLAFAFDVGLIEAPDSTAWAALGAIRIEDPYATPEQASATITACLNQLSTASTIQVERSGFTVVRGADRVHERAGILETNGRTREFRVLVADLQSPESLAIYIRVADPLSEQHRAVVAAESGLGRA